MIGDTLVHFLLLFKRGFLKIKRVLLELYLMNISSFCDEGLTTNTTHKKLFFVANNNYKINFTFHFSTYLFHYITYELFHNIICNHETSECIECMT